MLAGPMPPLLCRWPLRFPCLPLQISTSGSDFDTLLAAYVGSSLASLVVLGRNNDCGSGLITSCLLLPIPASSTATALSIQVDGAFGAKGNVQLAVLTFPPPPNDNFASATSMAADGSSSSNTQYATLEAGEPSAGTGGSASVWFRVDAGPTVSSLTVSGLDA